MRRQALNAVCSVVHVCGLNETNEEEFEKQLMSYDAHCQVMVVGPRQEAREWLRRLKKLKKYAGRVFIMKTLHTGHGDGGFGGNNTEIWLVVPKMFRGIPAEQMVIKSNL